MCGQGDSTLIRTKYNKNILIDCGEGHSDKYDYGKNIVLPYLLSHNIYKLDYLILSHRRFRPYWWSILYIRKF